MDSSLLDRIKAAEQRQNPRPLRPAEPVPFVPAWRRRLQAKDMTNLVLVNGAFQRPDDGGAA